MGNSWQEEEHKAFFEEYLALFSSSRDEGTLRSKFWPMVTEEWFKRWPLSEPPSDLVESAGSAEKALKVWRDTQVNVSIPCRRVVSSRTYPLTADEEGLQVQGCGERGSE